jgi:hypothetical protein
MLHQMPDEMLLGFDARAFPAPRWDDRRRRAYLLRQDVMRPLSVDTGAWPSLFASGPDADDGIPVPAWVGPTGHLWERLDRMRACLTVADADLTGAAIVAVGWLSQLGFHDPDGPYAVPSEPGDPLPGWQLLGYDVGDRGLLSGLCNCGWEPGEIPPSAARSAAELNEHHLFREADPAFGYAALTSRRVPEHAPFFVYSVYRLLE